MKRNNVIHVFYSNRKYIIYILFFMIASSVINVYQPIINKKVIDIGFMKRNYYNIIYYCLILVITYLINSILQFLMEKIRIELYCGIKYDLYQLSYLHLLEINDDFLRKNDTSDIIQELDIDIDHISDLVDTNLITTIMNVFMMIGGIIGLFLINKPLTILLLLCIPIKIFTELFFIKMNVKYNQNYIKANEKFVNIFSDYIAGMNDIKIYNLKKATTNNFNKYKANEIEQQKKSQMLLNINEIFDNLYINVIIILIYILGARFLVNENVSVGTVVTFSTYSLLVLNPISMILHTFFFLGGISPSYNRLNEFFDIKEENSGIQRISDFEKLTLTFKNVSYNFENNKIGLKNLNFSIQLNEKVAFCGANGSGKSTLLDLIIKIKRPQEGIIELNGIDINVLNIDGYRSLFSVCLQNSHLFNKSIFQNICLEENKKRNEIAKNEINEYIQSFLIDKDLNSSVGINGSLLSKGQKQMVLLLRALLGNRRVIILDEALSHIDILKKEKLYKIISELPNGMLIATHERKILEEVDKIIFMIDGEINEIGTFNELMKNNDFKLLMEKYE